jgi:hypothetical protein
MNLYNKFHFRNLHNNDMRLSIYWISTGNSNNIWCVCLPNFHLGDIALSQQPANIGRYVLHLVSVCRLLIGASPLSFLVLLPHPAPSRPQVYLNYPSILSNERSTVVRINQDLSRRFGS